MVSGGAGDRSWLGFNVLVVSPTPTHPRDHGNRKRIFEICAELRRRGARIDFIHYPGEHDWRHAWPARHEAEMRAAWDSYQLVAPSRGLHEEARGHDHLIDEWADPSLTQFLAWACRVRAYDVAIVNYTWMSFCFDSIPSNVFKICDTHDVFAGRRELLEANGIGAEFFHTTKAEEARGLKRADLVWAIKAAERTYFEQELHLPHCVTMLHAEPESGSWAGPVSRDGWLRVGVIGARNNINKCNLEEFLNEALPMFESYMAPVKIVIAGGCSDDFENWSHPNIEIRGRVGEVADFYRSVDVVIAPMRFSTGLKIKVSEALAAGVPLVAHAHAMDGYPTRERLHLLASFKEMALELARLSFDSTPLAALARRSRGVCEAIRREVSNSFDSTLKQLVARTADTICIVAPAEAFDPTSLLHDHLSQTLDYLRFVSGLAIYVCGNLHKAMNFDVLRKFDLSRRVFADPQLVETLGAQAPDFFTAVRLSELLEVRGFRRVYLMTDCRDELLVSTGALRQAIVRYDAIAIGGGDADALIEALLGRVEVVVVSAEPTRMRAWRGDTDLAQIVFAPFRRVGAYESLKLRASVARAAKPLMILARAADPLAEELSKLAAKLGWDSDTIDPHVPATIDALMGRGLDKTHDPLGRFANLSLLVDLTELSPLADVIGAAALLLGVPRVAFQRGSQALALHGFPTPLRPTSVARLFTTVADCAANPDLLKTMREIANQEAASKCAFDAGWTVVWGRLVGRGSGNGAPGDAVEELLCVSV